MAKMNWYPITIIMLVVGAFTFRQQPPTPQETAPDIINHRGIIYLDDDEELKEEEIPGLAGMKFIYQYRLGKASRFILTRSLVSKIYGWYKNRWHSRHDIATFVKKNNINMDDFVGSVEPGKPDSYTSFNDFFKRKLKPGARLIDHHQKSLVSPADGKVTVIKNISETDHFMVKKSMFDLREFLQDQELAHEFNHGTMFIFRLAPRDYHRFHMPCNGTVTAIKQIGGLYESVNPLAYIEGVKPLIKNKRHVIRVQSPEFGQVLVVPVGAILVGTIQETCPLHTPLIKGDELGYFSFGGSTVVVLVQHDKVSVKPHLLNAADQQLETSILVGKRVGRKI